MGFESADLPMKSSDTEFEEWLDKEPSTNNVSKIWFGPALVVVLPVDCLVASASTPMWNVHSTPDACIRAAIPRAINHPALVHRVKSCFAHHHSFRHSPANKLIKRRKCFCGLYRSRIETGAGFTPSLRMVYVVNCITYGHSQPCYPRFRWDWYSVRMSVHVAFGICSPFSIALNRFFCLRILCQR